MKGYVLVIALLSYHGCSGYIYKWFGKYKLINKRTNKPQQIILFADFHLKSHSANKGHRAHVESQLTRCATAKGKLIVEDLSSVNNDGRMICCNFGINCSEGVLGQLANKARSLGVAVDNIEYRYCRVAGIGPLLNNIEANPHSFKSSSTITMSSLHKEVVNEMEKIKKYDDGKLLNDCYKRTVCKVQAVLSKMGFNTKITVADYCKKLPRKQYRQELERLCIFDSALIDMNIMHAIAGCSDDQLIFVVAGGSHVEQVSALLKRMGYKSLLKRSKATGPVFKKVLNSDGIDAPSEVHPKPVDITIIDKFIR